ncbi:MAG: VOC family protein [Sciscionella sp.]|nr:VOC family protein [Sciscionella sp.]
MAGSIAFYRALGLTGGERQDGVGVVFMVSPSNPTAQVLLAGSDGPQPMPDMSIEVDGVHSLDAAHAALVEHGADVLFAPRDEPWGVRRFFVRDPNGRIVNVMTHLD